MLEVYKIFSALRLSRTDRTACWWFMAISSLLCGVIYRVQTSHKLTKDLGVYKTTYSRGGKRGLDCLACLACIVHVCSQHLFGLPLRINGMHITQFDHRCLDLRSLVIWSCKFWTSVMWNLRKAQHSKSVLTFNLCCSLSITFGYY